MNASADEAATDAVRGWAQRRQAIEPCRNHSRKKELEQKVRNLTSWATSHHDLSRQLPVNPSCLFAFVGMLVDIKGGIKVITDNQDKLQGQISEWQNRVIIVLEKLQLHNREVRPAVSRSIRADGRRYCCIGQKHR
jgi:hypothetical protein